MIENRADDEKCEALLNHVFGPLDILQARVAPEGWESSPYVRIHHPTVEQMYEEALIMHQNMSRLSAKKGEVQPPPTFEEIQKQAEQSDDTVEPLRELLDVFGGCIWSVFSNNHTVTGSDGQEYDLGSFRGTGSFLASFIEKNYPEAPIFDYMDFYCADLLIERRADVTPIYELIFSKLKEQGCMWSYSFPRIYLIDFSDAKETDNPDSPEAYDPNTALAEQLEKDKKKAEVKKLQQELDEGYEQIKEQALYKPPPMIVQAYWNVYESWPEGWVHE